MSVVPLRKWRRSCYAQSSTISIGPGNMLVGIKSHRRYSSGPVPISPLANKTLGEFVRAKKLEIVLQIYPADMPLIKVLKYGMLYCPSYFYIYIINPYYANDNCSFNLLQFCRICPNSVTIEDENMRAKVMVAIHAARAHEVRNFTFVTSVGNIDTIENTQ